MTQTFGAALRAAREAAGLSYAELSRRTGINRTQLYEVEGGKRRAFHASRARELAAVLEVDPIPLMALAAVERGIDFRALAGCDLEAVDVLIVLVQLLPGLPQKKVAALRKLILSMK